MDQEFDDDLVLVAGTRDRVRSTRELARKTKAEVAEIVPLLESSADRVEQSTERLEHIDQVISDLVRGYAWR
jgi:hypothetical protein